MSPAAVMGQLVRCVLGVMEKKVGTSAEVNDLRIQIASMFDVGTEDDRLCTA